MIYDPLQEQKVVNVIISDIKLNIIKQKYNKIRLFMSQHKTNQSQKYVCVNFIDRNNDYFGNPFIILLDMNNSMDQIY